MPKILGSADESSISSVDNEVTEDLSNTVKLVRDLLDEDDEDTKTDILPVLPKT